jgi:hypothetical protein
LIHTALVNPNISRQARPSSRNARIAKPKTNLGVENYLRLARRVRADSLCRELAWFYYRQTNGRLAPTGSVQEWGNCLASHPSRLTRSNVTPSTMLGQGWIWLRIKTLKKFDEGCYLVARNSG